jgi:hypothetical protein
MSNLLNKDPIELDTTDSAINTGRIVNVIKSVEWAHPSNVGDVAILKDANGNNICDFVCSISEQSQRNEFGDLGAPFTGPLDLVTLTSGKLYLRRA